MSKRRIAEATATVEPLADQAAETTTLEAPASDEGQNEPAAPQRDPVRSWRERKTGPLRYQVLTDSRIHKIVIKFNLADGQRTPPDEVLAVMRAAKVNGDGSPTGLRFEDSRTHGKAWMIPNDPEGRALLSQIETHLENLAVKMSPTPQVGAA